MGGVRRDNSKTSQSQKETPMQEREKQSKQSCYSDLVRLRKKHHNRQQKWVDKGEDR